MLNTVTQISYQRIWKAAEFQPRRPRFVPKAVHLVFVVTGKVVLRPAFPHSTLFVPF
jgi:hypothetical protein